MKKILLLFVFTGLVFAQPRVNSIGQAADFTGPLAPGTLATLFGSNLATTPASAASVPLPTVLGGVTVRVNGNVVPLTFANPTQINFQLPTNIAPGPASLSVTTAVGSSSPVNFTVAARAPGVFQYGANRGVVQNQDFSLNTEGNLAKRAEVLTVYLTGIGVTEPPVREGTVAPSSPLARPAAESRAFIAGAPARILFLGLTPGAVGLAQANVEVPSVIASGSYPLVLEVGGVLAKPVMVSVEGSPESTLPDAARCISGTIDSVTRSLEKQLSGEADEIQLGRTTLCASCDDKVPAASEFTKLLEKGRTAGMQGDICYDSSGNVSALRLRR
jgi:uncharacterized protein (TIGR03437 family)